MSLSNINSDFASLDNNNDPPLPTSFRSRKFSHSLQFLSPAEICQDIQSMSREKVSQAVIKKAKSIGTLHDYPSGYHDNYYISGTTSRNKLKLLRQYSSLDNLGTSTHNDEEDYVIHSLYSSETFVNNYLELLPTLTYEQIQDEYDHLYDEIN